MTIQQDHDARVVLLPTSRSIARPLIAWWEENSERRIGLSFIAPAILFLVLFVVFPVFEVFRLSMYVIDFTTDEERFVGIANYLRIFQDPRMGVIAWNTAIWTVFSLIGQFALGLAAALCINQNLPGMKVIRTILLLPYVVPVIVLALFWRWLLDGSFGVVSAMLQSVAVLPPNQSPLAMPDGAMVSVILANIWRGFPFVMISYWAALQAIPQEQYEAAAVDGASTWQQFRYVTLPHLTEVSKVMLILRFIWTITFFDIIWLISRGGPGSATEHWPIWIYQEAMGYFRFGTAAALGVILAGVMILVSAALITAFRRKDAR